MNLFSQYVNQWYRNRLSLDRLFYCQIHVTKRCQKECAHCYFRELSSTCLDMPIDELNKFLKNLRKRANMLSLYPRVDFTGGDPLLYPHIKQAIELCQQLGIQYGFKCNPEMIVASTGNFQFGLENCNGISLSLDGLEETHDTIRGQGSFANTLEAIKIIKDLGIQLKISTTVSYDNAKDLIPLMELLRRECILVDDYTWVRYWSLFNSEKIITDQDLVRMFEELSEYYNEIFSDKSFYVHLSDGRLVPQILIGFKEHQWYPYFVQKGIIDEDIQRTVLTRVNCINCTATKHFYIIDPDMSIYKCRKLPETKMDFEEFVGLRNADLNINYSTECKKCYYYNGCGGCAAIAKSKDSPSIRRNNMCPYYTITNR